MKKKTTSRIILKALFVLCLLLPFFINIKESTASNIHSSQYKAQVGHDSTLLVYCVLIRFLETTAFKTIITLCIIVSLLGFFLERLTFGVCFLILTSVILAYKAENIANYAMDNNHNLKCPRISAVISNEEEHTTNIIQ